MTITNKFPLRFRLWLFCLGLSIYCLFEPKEVEMMLKDADETSRRRKRKEIIDRI